MEEEEDIINCIDFEADIDCVESISKRVVEIELRVGMEFEKIEDVTFSYGQYAKSKGFQIRRRNSRPKLVQFVCHREGFARSQSRTVVGGETSLAQPNRFTKTFKSGCRASLYVALDSSTKIWRITKFNDEHNHEMVSPKSRKYLRAHKNLSNSAKCFSEVFENEGIAVGKVMNVLNPIPDEAEFTKKDCYNYMTRMREKILDSGDAQAVHSYCVRQQELNSDFRYAIQLDEDDRMLNFFWVDARSRMAYSLFGEVVSFDTTYKTNKYNMPFASFVGIDNHMHTIMFGCALLQDESEKTFTWLFESWLHAMDDKVPISFVTDQDMTIMNAVEKVFPTTRHRLCIWHIKKKFPERLSHIYHDNSSFKGELNKCIHESLSIEEFESAWARLVLDYNLADNDWFLNLFDMRAKWVPAFCKGVFFGGMSTTGRSESINSFFDAFVHSGTTLKEFVHKFSQALENRYETYRRAEFDSRHKILLFSLGMDLEEHAGNVYTAEIFKLFHIELRHSLSYKRETILERECLRTYRVCSKLDKSEGVRVDYNTSTQEASCQCRNFEFTGYLCRHILSVLHMHSVDDIPRQYILSRWTKDVGRVLWELPIARDESSTSSIRMLELKVLFDSICKKCESSDDAFVYVKHSMDRMYADLNAQLDGTRTDIVDSSNPPQLAQSSANQSSYNIRDPNVTTTKGRKKVVSNRSTRIRSSLEIAVENTTRCSICLKTGHNKRTCPKVRD